MAINDEIAKFDRLPAGLVAALATRKPGMDTSELLAAITRAWGGADRLAYDLKAEFDMAKAGTVVRQRILEMVQRLIVISTEREVYTARKARDMDTTELHDYARAYMGRVIAAKAAQEGESGGKAEGVEEPIQAPRPDQARTD